MIPKWQNKYLLKLLQALSIEFSDVNAFPVWLTLMRQRSLQQKEKSLSFSLFLSQLCVTRFRFCSMETTKRAGGGKAVVEIAEIAWDKLVKITIVCEISIQIKTFCRGQKLLEASMWKKTSARASETDYTQPCERRIYKTNLQQICRYP